MRPSRVFILALCALALAPASAVASGSAVIRDCTDDGQLSKHYSQKDLQDAQRNLPTDVDEYTDCRDVIRRAQLGGGAGGGGGGGGTGAPGAPGGGSGGSGGSPPLSTPNSPDETAAVAAAQKGGGKAVQIAGRTVTPGASRFAAEQARNTLPTSLVVLLALLGVGALAGAGLAARNRVIARRQA
jgi:hypothetical protein